MAEEPGGGLIEAPAGVDGAEAAAAGGEQQTSAQAAAARPEWLPEKFWKADAGEPDYQGLAKSYGEVEKLIGKRWGDLADNERAIAASILRPQIEDRIKGELEAARKAAVPEKYEVRAPEGFEVQPEDPLLARAQKWASEHGLSQEQFDGLAGVWFETLAEAQAAEPSLEDAKKAIGPDYDKRQKAIATKVTALVTVPPAAGETPEQASAAGAARASALFAAIRTPEQFVALERILAATRETQPPAGDGQAPPSRVSEAELESMIKDERYWKDRNPAFVAKVTEGFKQLYGS